MPYIGIVITSPRELVCCVKGLNKRHNDIKLYDSVQDRMESSQMGGDRKKMSLISKIQRIASLT